MKIAILVIFSVVVLATAASANECTTGAVKQVECNTCRCLNGIWACTRMGCLTKRAAECSAGETKRIDCNSCFCSNGRWACTLKGCLRKRAIPARFEEVSRNKRDEFSCIPGQTFAKECNTCTCTADGKNAICTLRPCNSQTD